MFSWLVDGGQEKVNEDRLWIERNKRVFDRHTRSVQQLLSFIADEAVMWTLAGYKQVECLAIALGRVPGRDILAVM